MFTGKANDACHSVTTRPCLPQCLSHLLTSVVKFPAAPHVNRPFLIARLTEKSETSRRSDRASKSRDKTTLAIQRQFMMSRVFTAVKRGLWSMFDELVVSFWLFYGRCEGQGHTAVGWCDLTEELGPFPTGISTDVRSSLYSNRNCYLSTNP